MYLAHFHLKFFEIFVCLDFVRYCESQDPKLVYKMLPHDQIALDCPPACAILRWKKRYSHGTHQLQFAFLQKVSRSSIVVEMLFRADSHHPMPYS